jgi:2-(1,2-epoxy-1,2-dihydrophenyl)acetyl-CoA isomerase
MYEQIRYEVADPMATITLNRPDQLNAWTNQMAAEVKHAIAQAEADKSVVAIVLTGAGRGFCAGADLSDLEVRRRGSGRSGDR